MDLTLAVSGPFATMNLADHGARVVKVERPPKGDGTRGMPPWADGESAYYTGFNRGKQSIVLDFADPADRAVLLGLTDRADVVVENFRPGVTARLGIGYDVLAARNPRLVYLALSGYGQDSPYADRPAYDLVVQATSGHMAITGEPAGPPTKMGTVVADLVSGLYAYGAITTALLGRERTGRGSYVDLAMLDTMLAVHEPDTVLGALAGEPPPRAGNGHASIAPFSVYPAADASLVICAMGERAFTALCGVVGRPELARDERFAGNRRRVAHRVELDAALTAALAGGTAAHWCAALSAAGVVAGPVATPAQALTSDHAAARNMLTARAQVDNPVRFAGYDRPDTDRPAPALDQHGGAIRAEVAPR